LPHRRHRCCHPRSQITIKQKTRARGEHGGVAEQPLRSQGSRHVYNYLKIRKSLGERGPGSSDLLPPRSRCVLSCTSLNYACGHS
jgi:hypothetical protein